MTELVKGPMVWMALVLFFGGLILQGLRFYQMTRKKEKAVLPPGPGGEPRGRNLGVKGGLFPRMVRAMKLRYANLRASMFCTHPVMTGVTVVFHTFLFATPILLFAHNQLIRDAWGLSFPSLAESTTDMLTIILLLCGAFFLLRRVFVRRVRAISTGYDYLVLLITLAPFVTGFLAHHQWFDYPTMLLFHMVSGEVMLVTIPYTKLGHMLYFFFYRLLLGGEYGFGSGRRAW